MNKKIIITDKNLALICTKVLCDSGVEILYMEQNYVFEFLQNNTCSIVVFYDFNGTIPEDLSSKTIFINIHPSLLPAFEGQNAIQNAFDYGCKISGITVHYLGNRNKIIAQYPVGISLDDGFNNFHNNIKNAINKLIPIVLYNLINDNVFDYSTIIKNNCSNGGCSGCGGCH